MDGKSWRLRRIVKPFDNRTLILPMDHGLSMGPIQGLVSPGAALSMLRETTPDAVVLHKGLVRFLPRDLDPEISLIIHISGATDLSGKNTKRLVTGVRDALALGADGVSVHVNFGGPDETEMLADLGQVADSCMALGVPLLVMAYLRGGSLPENDAKGLAIAARACAELGADLVKLPWPGSVDAMEEIVAGCPVGVVMAGGSASQTDGLLKSRIEGALSAGAVGIAVGRNVFQSPDPAQTLRYLTDLVHSRDQRGWTWSSKTECGMTNGL